MCQGMVVISIPQNHDHSWMRARRLERSGLAVIRGHISYAMAKYMITTAPPKIR